MVSLGVDGEIGARWAGGCLTPARCPENEQEKGESVLLRINAGRLGRRGSVGGMPLVLSHPEQRGDHWLGITGVNSSPVAQWAVLRRKQGTARQQQLPRPIRIGLASIHMCADPAHSIRTSSISEARRRQQRSCILI